MKKLLLSVAFLTISVLTFAQGNVLLKIEVEDVTKEEFISLYQKNNNDSLTEESVSEYLDLFINFKLKVKEAERLGLDTLESFKAEFNKYKKQLTDSYLTDKEVTNQLIKEAYSRMQEEVHASHILLEVSPNALPEDTLKVYNQIKEIKKRVEKGESFEQLAKEFSDDPSAQKNGGDLGYFSALRMVYPFESAAYQTSVGSVSEPVRTRFGYHILKVHDKRPSTGEWRVAHIMIKTPKDSTDEKFGEKFGMAEKLVNEIHHKIKNGESFETLARMYSDDPGTKRNGGKLPWFKANSYPKSFEDVCFALDTNGQISKPFLTPYGFHIVKRIDHRELPSFEEVEAEIRRKVEKDSRSKLTKQKTLARIKEEFGYKDYSKNLKHVISQMDSSFFSGDLDLSAFSKSNKKLFKLGDDVYRIEDFLKYLNQYQGKTRQSEFHVLVNRFYKSFQEETIINTEKANLPAKYPEYARLLEEYRNGILLFDLMEEKVWNKAVNDSTGLKEFYETVKDNYTWEERVDAVIYNCASEDIANQVLLLLNDTLSPQNIMNKLNGDSQLNVRVDQGKFESNSHKVLNTIEWKKGISSPIQISDNYYVVEIKEVLPKQHKELNEVRGSVIAKYQDYLDKEWIKELRDSYEVEYFDNVFQSIFK